MIRDDRSDADDPRDPEDDEDPGVAFVEEFDRPSLDPARWVDHYLPHWTTPDRSRARYVSGSGHLELRIESDQLDWRPEDAPLRVSNLQTAAVAGPVGSSRGTHRHAADLVVRTAVERRVLWAPSAGRVEVTVTASTDESCMLAVWLVGTEEDDDRASGEICVFEIDSDNVGLHSTTARVGVKAHHDPRLVTEMVEVVVPGGVGDAQTWAANWGPTGVLVACDGRVVFSSPQRLDYPLQLMIDLFEIGPGQEAGHYPKTARVHRVVAR